MDLIMQSYIKKRKKHNTSSKIAVQGLVFVAHPLYIQEA
jgi:hypothetical protein